jgi:hypothetical protein
MDAPPLEMATGNITVSEVVERVKCELAYAFAPQISNDKFLWMQTWTVKADMTLQASVQDSLSPSVGYTNYHKNAYNTAAGPTSLHGSTIAAIPQFFTFGANANLGEQAFRTETISFSLSLKELRQWLDEKQKHDPNFVNQCFPAKGAGVGGNLGLGEWVKSALEPVRTGQLLAGYHPAPGTSSTPKGATTLPTGAKASTLVQNTCKDDGNPKTWSDDIKRLRQDISTNEKNLTGIGAGREIINARRSIRELSDLVENFKPVLMESYRADYTARWKDFLFVMSKRIRDIDFDYQISIIDKAAERADRLTAHDALENCKNARDAYTKFQSIYATAADTGQTGFAKLMAQILTDLDSAKKALPDPPLDALTHSVQFIVSYGAGISPNWTLAVWKGPAGSQNLASASGGRQHILNIAAGPPDKADATRILNNLNVLQALHP